mmetsp:Transcript_15329/g.17697  ORF Transcript_15329/g.17697 Transcript_15329/m.17697 type:complete len:138 (+) Transcript_15329:29-442(+)
MVNTALWTRNLFLVSAVIAAFTSFSRADYNLPLFIFAYMAWGLQKSQKLVISWLIAFTLLTDLVWLLYWGPFWDSEAFVQGYWENGIHTLVIALSSINFALKIAILIIIVLNEQEVKESFKPAHVTHTLKNLHRAEY